MGDEEDSIEDVDFPSGSHPEAFRHQCGSQGSGGAEAGAGDSLEARETEISTSERMQIRNPIPKIQ